MIDRGKTVQEAISFIAKLVRPDVNKLFLEDAEPPPVELFGALYESKDELFVFSTASTPAMTSHLSPHSPPTSTSPVPSRPDLSASNSPVPSGPSLASHSRDESLCAASAAGGSAGFPRSGGVSLGAGGASPCCSLPVKQKISKARSDDPTVLARCDEEVISFVSDHRLEQVIAMKPLLNGSELQRLHGEPPGPRITALIENLID